MGKKRGPSPAVRDRVEAEKSYKKAVTQAVVSAGGRRMAAKIVKDTNKVESIEKQIKQMRSTGPRKK
jgi:hypothetical protein